MSESAPAAPAPAPESASKPAASDLLQPSPAMTVEQAQIKKAELSARPVLPSVFLPVIAP